MKVSEVLEKAFALLGPNGENWVNSCPASTREHCAITAVWEIEKEQPFRALDVLRRAVELNDGFLSLWNDSRKWPEIQQAFQKAIALARQEESLDASK